MPLLHETADGLAAALTQRLERSVLTPPSLPGWRLSAAALEAAFARPVILWYAPAQLDAGGRALQTLPAEDVLLAVIAHQPMQGAVAEAIVEDSVLVGLVGLPRDPVEVLAARTGLAADWLAPSHAGRSDWLMLELLEALVRAAAGAGAQPATPGALLRQEAEAGMLCRQLLGTAGNAVLAEQYAARVLSFVHDDSLPLSTDPAERDFIGLRRVLFSSAGGSDDPVACVAAARRLLQAEAGPEVARDFLTDYVAAAALLLPQTS